MLKRLRLFFIALAALPLVLLTACGGTPTANNALAVGGFGKGLVGTSQFSQLNLVMKVTGTYTKLRPNASYFTVIYPNADCDPSQAFPVGPFTTDRLGNATLARTVIGVPLGTVSFTNSMSVRRGDTLADIDHDGKLGPTDVVAVPLHPEIGLVECNHAPLKVSATG